MKHRVTNFGTEPLTVKVPLANDVEVMPGQSWVGEVDVIHHGPGRTHYSVRPAERQAGFAAFGADEEE